MYVPHFVTHLSVSEHLSRFHLLATVNSAAVNVFQSLPQFFSVYTQKWSCLIIQ